MRSLLSVTGMLARGGTPAERTRRRLMAAGAMLATWFLFGAANVLALRGHLSEWLGPASQPGTRGGTAFALVVLVLPVTAFLYQSSRLATADRERRLSALRLAGATPSQVRLLGAAETTRAALIGTVTGAATYLLLQWVARRLLLDPRSPANVGVPPLLCAAAMVLVIAAAAVSGLLAGRHVVATPLGVTVRANRRPPRPYAIALPVVGLVLITGLRFLGNPVPLAGVVLLVVGLLFSSSSLVRLSARVTGRRARSAETLLAARALEADARPWGRTLSVVGLAVAVGTITGWAEAEMLMERRATEAFWLSSFVLVDLALLVAIAVAASALLVHHAEYFLERGPVLSTLRATGTPEVALRRVLVRQALIASVPVCVVAALMGLYPLVIGIRIWILWPVTRAVLMAALGILAAVLSAALSRRRLRRTVTPALLRVE
ncbi:hypothetical protein GCM10027176_64520 [Actinoallomurus bryophytorum]|uniref:FtsX-like permease family protein n=1 Tax=Actinoallomurus bryophytorum TaxID=1490222 RepID=A0A543CDK9_9ACTN|nr:FtsX-like permease family protein [Actinoallomurus bryophytorum]TQL95183.1 FtsX-like permease family protein [Actinoallomurus bryophytorum]